MFGIRLAITWIFSKYHLIPFSNYKFKRNGVISSTQRISKEESADSEYTSVVNQENKNELNNSESIQRKGVSDVLEAEQSQPFENVDKELRHFESPKLASLQKSPSADDHLKCIKKQHWIHSKVEDMTSLCRSTDCLYFKEINVNCKYDLKPACQSTYEHQWPSFSESSSSSSQKDTNISHNPKGSITSTEDDFKATELATKKARLKQKLIRSAKSVGIFSLKLKEKRQREAQKAANIAVEHVKAISNLSTPEGELSLIPLEQLIQIEDILEKDNN